MPDEHPKVLATDLDGTLIPLPGNAQHNADLKLLSEALARENIKLVFVTGRHFGSVQRAINDFNLPVPDTIICDVGSSIYLRQAGTFHAAQSYADQLGRILNGVALAEVGTAVSLQKFESLRIQEDEKQGPYKLSYYSTAELLQRHCEEINDLLNEMGVACDLISSLDPFNDDGLIDILPRGVSKAYALDWWRRENGLPIEDVIFAGDSGNDLAALSAGYRSIIVFNAHQSLIDSIRAVHDDNQWTDRLHIASTTATSGVLEGCRRFGLLP